MILKVHKTIIRDKRARVELLSAKRTRPQSDDEIIENSIKKIRGEAGVVVVFLTAGKIRVKSTLMLLDGPFRTYLTIDNRRFGLCILDIKSLHPSLRIGDRALQESAVGVTVELKLKLFRKITRFFGVKPKVGDILIDAGKNSFKVTVKA